VGKSTQNKTSNFGLKKKIKERIQKSAERLHAVQTAYLPTKAATLGMVPNSVPLWQN